MEEGLQGKCCNGARLRCSSAALAEMRYYAPPLTGDEALYRDTVLHQGYFDVLQDMYYNGCYYMLQLCWGPQLY